MCTCALLLPFLFLFFLIRSQCGGYIYLSCTYACMKWFHISSKKKKKKWCRFMYLRILYFEWHEVYPFNPDAHVDFSFSYGYVLAFIVKLAKWKLKVRTLNSDSFLDFLDWFNSYVDFNCMKNIICFPLLCQAVFPVSLINYDYAL